MKSKILLFILSLIFFGIANCNLLEPSYLSIKNNSDYTIDVEVKAQETRTLSLDKNESKFILLFPGKVKIKIKIEQIFFEKEYSLILNYQEKRQFSFDISE